MYAQHFSVYSLTEVAIKYGSFITVAIEFLIVALVMFMVIKAMNAAKKKTATKAKKLKKKSR